MSMQQRQQTKAEDDVKIGLSAAPSHTFFYISVKKVQDSREILALKLRVRGVWTSKYQGSIA